MFAALLAAAVWFAPESLPTDVAKTQITILQPGKKKSGPTVESFDKKLKEMKERFEKETRTKNFKEKKFKSETGKVRTWDQLTKLEKRVYLIAKMQALEDDLDDLNEEWQDALKNAPEKKTEAKEEGLLPFMSFLPGCPFCPPAGTEALKADVEKSVASLTSLRKKLAVRHEKVVERLYHDFPDDFTVAEAQLHVRQLRAHHDEEKLSERPKK